MLEILYRTAEIFSALGTLASMAFYTLCSLGALSFLRDKADRGAINLSGHFLPPVSILKPLKGTDPGFRESLRSHCLQEYPDYELIFGVSDPNDPAIEEVENLRAEFPARQISLIVCREELGANIKVSNLVQMLPHARHEYLIVNDSDIRVPADYVSTVIQPLQHADIGLVTCLYRAIAAPSLGSKLESLGISTDFIPGVLAARQLEGIRFGLGSTLAFRRADLQGIGGFEALVNHLADDFELGSRIAAKGLKVEPSSVIVETFLPAYRFGDFLRHQLRWGRTIRDSRRAGYFGLIFTFGVPWALLTLALSGAAAWAWTLLATTLLTRFGMALIVGSVILRDSQVIPRFLLVLLRDLLAPFVWLASLIGNRVRWRDKSFILKDGKLERVGS